MKILLVSSFCGWMGVHMRHFAAALSAAGHDVRQADYPRMRTIFGLRPRVFEQELRDIRLEKIVKRCKPDLILFVAVRKFDFHRLREYYSGPVAVYDYDGPRRTSVEKFIDIGPVDLLLTTSRYLQRELKLHGLDCRYLPNGVDTDYYAPGPLSAEDRRLFSAPVSYIGRATPRRAELCSALADTGIVLYGDRWRNYPSCSESNRLKRLVEGEELVKIYRASNAVLNILQEPLDLYRTIMSLQCFAVPATGTCLIAERVEEFPEAFEEGREVLTFETAGELREHLERMLREPETARRIGEAGRRRCLACHTHHHRVKELLAMLE